MVKLSSKDLVALKKAFELFDKDGDGSINRQVAFQLDRKFKQYSKL